jgi:hypothetical protein
MYRCANIHQNLIRFQRQCQDLGLIIPTISFDNFASLPAGGVANTGNDNNFETYCGTFLNPLAGQTVSGTVLGSVINKTFFS